MIQERRFVNHSNTNKSSLDIYYSANRDCWVQTVKTAGYVNYRTCSVTFKLTLYFIGRSVQFYREYPLLYTQ